MAARKNIKPRRKAQKAPLDGDSMPPLPEPVLEFLYQQHRRLYQAIGVVSCARYASDSKIVGEPDISGGLQVAEQIMGDVAEAIEDMIPLTYFHNKNDEEVGDERP